MDYPFELLDPESFQQLSQALILRSHPETRCFPVAQPDGGRDAVTVLVNPSGREFIVFQVKFVRNPQQQKEPHRWLVETIQNEAPKIVKLIPKGAARYILITNISGTSHLGAGSIDTLEEVLRAAVPIPSVCWWRDDLSRRLDGAWDLKWVYPQLMTGPDLLRAVLESGLTADVERRSTAIRTFLRDQYRTDRDVKFKQVELQNRLLDLFVDVPVSARLEGETRVTRLQAHVLRQLARDPRIAGRDDSDDVGDLRSRESIVRESRQQVGAATLLLSDLLAPNLRRLVLEGAPGQGKSTIAQYICQVNRMRVLGEKSDLTFVPEHHRCGSVRLPFKVDLRDLATWLARKNPFAPDAEDTVPENWHRSLEAFLAAQIQHHSGGASFTVSDLHAVLRISAAILVFDGLDEVADIARRQEVVDEVVRGVNRLEESTASLRAVVTSRPAAFANSPGLPTDLFPHFQLDSLARPLIDEYADKWLRVRRITGREHADFKKILKEKLDQPHLRDLARNPMQLAILLSLILTRGSSLPDKRTALYDAYIELFFSRESEKSIIVRQHRDLLIDVHRFLAWTLHAEAERGQESGSITTQRLQQLVADYIGDQGYDRELATTLFTGMVERVVALVSRVEGTYEFEVQPLREYFAARFLYETAPYSPPGAERRGTKPDRFDAISRNFYWLNVARFYAGCFSKGELASLIDRLQELVVAPGFARTSHPRLLAAMLLSDWVFSQHPRSVRDVIRLILDGLGLRFVLSSNSRRTASGHPLVLPGDCGRDELIAHCISVLRSYPPRDYALDIVDVLRANASNEELAPQFLRFFEERSGEARTRWMEHGVSLGLLSSRWLSLQDLVRLMEDDRLSVPRLQILLRGKRADYLEGSEEVLNTTIDGILRRDITSFRHSQADSLPELLCQILDPQRWAMAFSGPQPFSLADMWPAEGYGTLSHRFDVDVPDPNSRLRDMVLSLNEIATTLAERFVLEWATELEPWNALVEATRDRFGPTWAGVVLATVAGGIRSHVETYSSASEFFDESIKLCPRIRYARLRAGNANWWKQQFTQARHDHDFMMLSLVLLTWGGESTLVALASSIDTVLQRLEKPEWKRLNDALGQTLAAIGRSGRSNLTFDLSSLPISLSERTVTVLSRRAKPESRHALYGQYLETYEGDDVVVLEHCHRLALETMLERPDTWPSALATIRRAYEHGIAFGRYASHNLTRRRHMVGLPFGFAEAIADSPGDYPGYLVSAAESRCRGALAGNIVPVATVAAQEQWFAGANHDTVKAT